jgi:hypothetical protein
MGPEGVPTFNVSAHLVCPTALKRAFARKGQFPKLSNLPPLPDNARRAARGDYARKRKCGGRQLDAISGGHTRHRLDRQGRRLYRRGGSVRR